MSRNCLIGVIKDATIADLSAVNLEAEEGTISAAEATSLDFAGLAAAQHGTNVLLFASNPSFLETLEQLNEVWDGEVARAVFGGVAHRYAWLVDGPGLHRMWVTGAGQTVEDNGPPLAEEAGVDNLDEDTLFGLLAERHGLPADWPDLRVHELYSLH